MPEAKNVNASAGDVLLLVGTMRALLFFVRTKREKIGKWAVLIFRVERFTRWLYDDRQNRKRLWAAVNSSYWGSYLSSSEDFGKTWTDPKLMA